MAPRLSLRTIVMSAAFAFSFLTASHALAAGEITIIQRSPVGIFGDYVLHLPNGTQVNIHEDEIKNFPVAEPGAYTLRLTPPSDARFTVTLAKSGSESVTSSVRDIAFTLADAQTVAITISYSYSGTIMVESEPEGGTFELLGPNITRMTGTTPASFTGMPPGSYRVTFQKQEGCDLTSPIQRTLGANETLTFAGQFHCTPVLPPVSSSSSSSSSSSETGERTARIWVAAQQAEVLPGSSMRFTITMKNTGTRTIHNATISAQFDPETLQILSPLPRFGTLEGNTVVWHISELYAGKYWTVNLPFGVNKDLKEGTQAAITARVSGGDIDTTDHGLLVATAKAGVVGLPQAGARFDILFLLATFSAAFLLSKSSRKWSVKGE